MKTPKELGITSKQFINLEKLANYLLSDELHTAFDMTHFGDNNCVASDTNCGTVGCAVGHGPYAGIRKNKNEDWYDYSFRQFGVGESLQKDAFSWMFHGNWKCIDNSPQGAGKRVKYFLENGLPDKIKEQMYGRECLCY